MILERIKSTIKKYNLIQRNEKIVIGVSGGPDSLALLYLLNALKKELKISLHIVHLDHMLRNDSNKDKLFVEKIAKRLKLPITSAKINVKALAKRGCLEEIARNARLSFLFKVAKDVKADKVALGHNLDDQVETVLMRILRGCGLYGLSGILPKRNISGFDVIRPLLELKRKDIELFLKKKRLKPCIDKSNLDDIYFRNRIRNRLLPLLEKDYNKDIKQALSNLSETAGYDYDYLSQRAELAMRQQGQKINLDKFLSLHIAIQRLALRLVIGRLKGNLRRVTLQHIKEIEDLIFNRPINSVVDLPEGISVMKKKNDLSFYKK